jgi:hypothetical protein
MERPPLTSLSARCHAKSAMGSLTTEGKGLALGFSPLVAVMLVTADDHADRLCLELTIPASTLSAKGRLASVPSSDSIVVASGSVQ